jgi:hypothetical protein
MMFNECHTSRQDMSRYVKIVSLGGLEPVRSFRVLELRLLLSMAKHGHRMIILAIPGA